MDKERGEMSTEEGRGKERQRGIEEGGKRRYRGKLIRKIRGGKSIEDIIGEKGERKRVGKNKE